MTEGMQKKRPMGIGLEIILSLALCQALVFYFLLVDT
jgi:hypothetical protein